MEFVARDYGEGVNPREVAKGGEAQARGVASKEERTSRRNKQFGSRLPLEYKFMERFAHKISSRAKMF